MLAPSGPVLIECAGRVPGDAIVELIDAAYEIDLVAALLAALAGERPELPARAARGSAIRFVTAVPGRVLGVEGLAEVLTRPGVVRAAVSASAGDHIGELRSSWDRLGEVLTTGRDAAQAAARGDVAVAALRVVTVGEPVSADGVPR
jgi:biotin carboxylase